MINIIHYYIIIIIMKMIISLLLNNSWAVGGDTDSDRTTVPVHLDRVRIN